MMVFGQPGGRQTLPISIYNDYVSGELSAAAPGVIALSAISLCMVLLYNRTLLTRRAD
jgi:ABC-type sulfate transport system permease component